MTFLIMCFSSAKVFDCLISRDFKLALSHLFFRNQEELPITPSQFQELFNHLSQFPSYTAKHSISDVIAEWHTRDCLARNFYPEEKHCINKFLLTNQKKESNFTYNEWHQKYYSHQDNNIYLLVTTISLTYVFQLGIQYSIGTYSYEKKCTVKITYFDANRKKHKLKSIPGEKTITQIPIISVYYPLYGRIYPFSIANKINEYFTS